MISGFCVNCNLFFLLLEAMCVYDLRIFYECLHSINACAYQLFWLPAESGCIFFNYMNFCWPALPGFYKRRNKILLYWAGPPKQDGIEFPYNCKEIKVKWVEFRKLDEAIQPGKPGQPTWYNQALVFSLGWVFYIFFDAIDCNEYCTVTSVIL